ncbi:hypothetical protein Gocc_2937 [Gaiella occulta]|uniref:Uncharacterized protein n=1 Tax=Gaiella occulta TaxID=1002870 RepID=A0A7M2YV34_9ACTN|nr:hypothetical protein [Gaiella occulta]RDI73337.1 hypothetical protein Gocc_2937 [Gaiella occulta]
MSGYPEGSALRVWEEDGVTMSVVRHSRMGHLCGYARFPRRPVAEDGYDGILTFVPVHGGITYAREDTDGSMVYGFDCSHYGDWTDSDRSGRVWEEDEVAEETRRMARGIKAAVAFEQPYLWAATPEERASVLDDYHESLGEPVDISDNFGAAIKLIGGLR